MSQMHYGEPVYWEARYEEELRTMVSAGFEEFDWYLPFEPVLESIIDTKRPHKVLILGIGRSNVVDVLYAHGFRNIVCIDISPLLIAQMQNKYREYPGVEFYIMDARELHQFQDNSFSIVIDKGCMDCIFCGLDLYESAMRFCQEVFRVMEDEGTCFLISHAPPAARVPYLRCVPWAIDTAIAPDGEEIIMYILLKTKDEEVLNRKVAGAEASVRSHDTGTVSSLDQDMNRMSNVKSSKNQGFVTVTASIDALAKMVEELGDD